MAFLKEFVKREQFVLRRLRKASVCVVAYISEDLYLLNIRGLECDSSRSSS